MSKEQNIQRPGARKYNEMRELNIHSGVSPYAEGSAEVSFGATKVLCTASIEPSNPPWMVEEDKGWITAEYGMLPRSTHTRARREAASGRQGGRTLEIQRLIGRSLRRAVNLFDLGAITLRIDCDVIVADGGTRSAAISGGWVALYEALRWASENGILQEMPRVQHVAAISVGCLEGFHLLDLCYQEDSSADFDLNIVMNERKELIEIQGTGEEGEIELAQLHELLQLGVLGIDKIIDAQKTALGS